MPLTTNEPSNRKTVHAAHSEATPPRLNPLQLQRLQRMTAASPLLISDDDSMSRAMYRSLFQHYRFTFLETRDSREVFMLCRQHPVGLVISDIQQPYMNGFQLLAHLRQHDETSHIPVIFITGSSALQPQALYDGVDGFLHKPCHPNAILQEIWRLLAGREIR